jgi:SAM-dependent methyltransferase
MRRPEFVARQSACPAGLLGRLIGRIMAHETSSANGCALELLDPQPADRILEVGFGHGATIARAAAAVSVGLVAGVDTSREMCRMATRQNRRAIAEGRVELRQAPAEALPYPDAVFDKVLTVHTLYFWPDLGLPFGEIARVLRDGGRLVAAHRIDRAAERDFPAPTYRFPSDEQVTAALRDAGLASAEPIHRTLGRATVSFRVARR